MNHQTELYRYFLSLFFIVFGFGRGVWGEQLF